MPAQVLEGGFANLPVDASYAFRAVMTAMARPGDIVEVRGAKPPPPMSIAAGVVVLTLCDPETPDPFGVQPRHAASARLDHISHRRTLCGRSRRHVCASVFADALSLAELPLGDSRITPDRSAHSNRSNTKPYPMTAQVCVGRGIKEKTTLSLPRQPGIRNQRSLFSTWAGLHFHLRQSRCGAAAPQRGLADVCSRKRWPNAPLITLTLGWQRNVAATPSVPELSVAQIRTQMTLAVNRVMAEGSLYDPGPCRLGDQAGTR